MLRGFISKTYIQKGTTWRVQLFINGVRDSKSGFTSKADAKLWAAAREAQILSGVNLPVVAAPVQSQIPTPVSITFKTLTDVFDKYAKEVSSTISGERWEKVRLLSFSRSSIAHIQLPDLGPEHRTIIQYADYSLEISLHTSCDQLHASSYREKILVFHRTEIANLVSVLRQFWIRAMTGVVVV